MICSFQRKYSTKMSPKAFFSMVILCLSVTHFPSTCQQSLFDTEAAKMERKQRFGDSTSTGPVRSSEQNILSQVSHQRNSDSLFDLAGSSVITTKTFPFVTEFDRDAPVSRIIDETAPARFKEPAERTTVPAPQNFDIITFGRDSRQKNQQQKDQNNRVDFDSEEIEKRRRVAATLRELEERIRLEERLAAARRINSKQQQQEQKQRQEQQRQDKPSRDNRRRQEFEDRDTSRLRDEPDDQPAANRDIVLRLSTSDRDQLVSAPSASYADDSAPDFNTYYPQPQLPHHEELQPADRSYDVYPPNPASSYEKPPPSTSYNKPSDNYEENAEDYYQRTPAVIASNSPQGPVIHITLNQHLPVGGGGGEGGIGPQRDTVGDMAPAPPSPLADVPSTTTAAPPAPPQVFQMIAQPQQGFFPGVGAVGAQYLLPINIPVQQPIQQSPPAALPAPVPPPTQPVVVVVSPNKKGGYGHYDSDSSGVGVKVLKGSSYHDEPQQSYIKPRDEENKGRSLSYTIRIPGDQSDTYGSRPTYGRPTTLISRNSRGAGDIYTSGSKPKEIFLNIGSDGVVRPSRRNKRSTDQRENAKRVSHSDVATRNPKKGDLGIPEKAFSGRLPVVSRSDTNVQKTDVTLAQRKKRSADGRASDNDGDDVHYFFHIQHDIAEDSPSGRGSKQVYQQPRRDYRVPQTVMRPSMPSVAPPGAAPPSSDDSMPTQQQNPQVQFVAVAVPFPVQQASPPQPTFNIPVKLSLASRPSATVHHYYVPKKEKFKKLKKGWMWF
ncbi:unnamed protein product [Notodromas monacha]|uniref:Uncharacterized protein n=1 Tax=Notodromas monacha TaxID=399045 RepID=A0A7R9BQA1_9CRUS|nr:unnamed protein product [Notodromas monacha]CAG0919680.1 unnamed protein product [Notodromas monacha]